MSLSLSELHPAVLLSYVSAWIYFATVHTSYSEFTSFHDASCNSFNLDIVRGTAILALSILPTIVTAIFLSFSALNKLIFRILYVDMLEKISVWHLYIIIWKYHLIHFQRRRILNMSQNNVMEQTRTNEDHVTPCITWYTSNWRRRITWKPSMKTKYEKKRQIASRYWT